MAAVKGFSVRFRGKHLFFINIPQILLYVFLGLFVCFTALPLIYVISTAFKPMDELFLYPPRFFVRNPTMSNFGDLFAALDNTSVPFSRAIFNSLFTSAVTVVLTVIVSAMAAYGMVKHHPRGSNLIFNLILVALMFSPHVTQIPNYMIVKNLGLINTYWALILPKIAVAFNMFLVKQFLEQMPDAYLEAARLDGANEWQLFWKIVMPYVRPAWATLVVFSFVGNWNDYFSPLVFTNSDAMKTLPLAIQSIAGGPGAASLATAGSMAASTFIMTLPTVLIYTLMQSKVLSTMSYSGIKA
ncbi:MAG: carbohydrate ABC transporter permease [Acutalibacteraceae bacterium]|nr:carbohydrate ABC transporter permease [Clostridiales bacterium]